MLPPKVDKKTEMDLSSILKTVGELLLPIVSTLLLNKTCNAEQNVDAFESSDKSKLQMGQLTDQNPINNQVTLHNTSGTEKYPKMKALADQLQHRETGNSFKTLFGQFLNKSVFMVTVEDPYFELTYQIHNLKMFLKLVFKRCPNLMIVKVISKKFSETAVAEFKSICSAESLEFVWDTRDTLHDRQIIIESWTSYQTNITLGRGLDIYHYPKNPSFEEINLANLSCREVRITVFIVNAEEITESEVKKTSKKKNHFLINRVVTKESDNLNKNQNSNGICKMCCEAIKTKLPKSPGKSVSLVEAKKSSPKKGKRNQSAIKNGIPLAEAKKKKRGNGNQ